LSSVGASQNKSKSWFGSAISEGTLINHASTYYIFLVSADKEKPKPVSIPPKSLFGSAISEGTLINHVSTYYVFLVSADKEKPKPVSIPPKPLFGSAISEGTLFNHASTYYVFFRQYSPGKARFYSAEAFVWVRYF
jgi:hypothetical protein